MTDYPNMVSPDDLRKIADGVENANHACETLATRYFASRALQAALENLVAGIEGDLVRIDTDAPEMWANAMRQARAALAKAEAAR